MDDAVVPEASTSGSSTSASSSVITSSETHERKRKQLFDCLNNLEQGLKGTILEQTTTAVLESPHRNRHAADASRNPRSLRRVEAPMDDAQMAISERRFRGEESIFKKPPPGIMKCLKPRRTPDYQVNPHKWKKYSLSDADTSDRTNTAAAFEFLREIEARKRDEAEADDAMDDEEAAAAAADGKIVFKNRRRIADGSSSAVAKFNQSAHLKPIVESGNAEENAEKAQLKGSKVVMPEYVIGQKVAAREKKGKLAAGSSKTSSSSASSASQLKLGHLFEEEED